jgi:hypothetical protein
MAVAVLVVVALQVGAPHAGRVPGWWVFPVLEIVLLVAVMVADPGRIDRRSASSRWLTIALFALMTLGILVALLILMIDIVGGFEGITATNLLGRGAALWLANVLIFSLWYWELDRGGPAERAAESEIPPSFAFPENATPELAAKGWVPRYPDYLYLSFTNATAFSPTDTLPLRVWAKMVMMLESGISLVTAILVIARAINELPG